MKYPYIYLYLKCNVYVWNIHIYIYTWNVMCMYEISIYIYLYLKFTPSQLQAAATRRKLMHINQSVTTFINIFKNAVHVFPLPIHGTSEVLQILWELWSKSALKSLYTCIYVYLYMCIYIYIHICIYVYKCILYTYKNYYIYIYHIWIFV